MNILIIENVYLGGAKYNWLNKFILTTFSILPTIYARQIAAITPKKHNVQILNERYEEIDFNKNYDIVNINFTTSTTLRAYEIAEEFKKRGTAVVFSGIHASLCPNEAKKHADSIIIGRGELNWLKLLDDFEKNQLKTIYNHITYDKNTKIPPTNIKLPGFVMTGAIEATRGCPYGCNFCPDGNINGSSNYYTRPINDVVDEIKSIPQKTFMFYDSSLTINPKYTKELFKKMKGLRKKFFCNGNSNVLANDIELVKLSKKAGCSAWLIGFESISQETVDNIGKNTNKVNEYKKAVQNIHDNKMAVIGCFIFGFDTDNKNSFNKTIKLIQKLRIDVCDFCILTPFPGTPIYNEFEKQGRILTKDWSKYNLKTVVFQPKQMTAEELNNGMKKIYSEFYSLPNTITRIFRGLKFGIYTFFVIFARNMVAIMNFKYQSGRK